MSLRDDHAQRRVVAVLWDDAHYAADEVEAHEVRHAPIAYLTVGVLVRSDAVGVTLSSDIGEGDLWRGRNFIPRGMIREEWLIGKVGGRRSAPRSDGSSVTNKPPGA